MRLGYALRARKNNRRYGRVEEKGCWKMFQVPKKSWGWGYAYQTVTSSTEKTNCECASTPPLLEIGLNSWCVTIQANT